MASDRIEKFFMVFLILAFKLVQNFSIGLSRVNMEAKKDNIYSQQIPSTL